MAKINCRINYQTVWLFLCVNHHYVLIIITIMAKINCRINYQTVWLFLFYRISIWHYVCLSVCPVVCPLVQKIYQNCICSLISCQVSTNDKETSGESWNYFGKSRTNQFFCQKVMYRIIIKMEKMKLHCGSINCGGGKDS